MSRRVFIRTARLLSAASAIASVSHPKAAKDTAQGAQPPESNKEALKQFQEILGYADERFKSFLQDPLNQEILLRFGEIAKKTILFEVLKKTL